METTKVTLKSKYHRRDFEIERLPLKKALQCQKIQKAFRKIKGYAITFLSYNTKGVTSIELSVF
jgi:hypothetical protein